MGIINFISKLSLEAHRDDKLGGDGFDSHSLELIIYVFVTYHTMSRVAGRGERSVLVRDFLIIRYF